MMTLTNFLMRTIPLYTLPVGIRQPRNYQKLTFQINASYISNQTARRIRTKFFHHKTTNDDFTSKTKEK